MPRSPRMAMDCPTCGRPNADGKDFCDCGEYLRWDPTGVFAIPAQAAGVAAPATPAPSRRRTPRARHRRPSRRSRCCSSCAPPARAPGDGPPTSALAVATSGLLQGFVRNQTKRVDSYALRVNGLPEAWVEISPPSVDLLPYGASGDAHESHFLVTITPAARIELTCRPTRLPARGRLARHRRGRREHSRRDRDPAVPRAPARGASGGPRRPPPRPLHGDRGDDRQRADRARARRARPRGAVRPELQPADAAARAEHAHRRPADRQAAPAALDRPPARADARGHRARARRPAAADADRRRPPEGLAPVLAPAADPAREPRSPPRSSSPGRRRRRCPR